MFVSVETSGEVVLVRVDRPPANAINLELLDELVCTLEGLAADVPAAVVIAGRDRFFSAGVDLKAVPGYGPDEHRRMVTGINRMVLATYGMSCPVIAAVTGHAIAVGLVLALCAAARCARHLRRRGVGDAQCHRELRVEVRRLVGQRLFGCRRVHHHTGVRPDRHSDIRRAAAAEHQHH